MKSLKYIVSAFFLVFIFSCSNTEKQKRTIIAGKIFNPQGKFIYLKSEGHIDTINIDTEGNFHFESTLINISRYYTFSHGRERTTMFVIPNDSIHISLDTPEFDETLTYSGDDSDYNNYIAKSLLLDENMEINYEGLFKLDEGNFIAKLDSIKLIKNEFLTKTLKQIKNVNTKFELFEKAKIFYEWADNMVYFEKAFKYYHQTSNIKLTDNYFKFIDGIELNDTALIKLPAYSSFIYNYLNSLSEKKATENTNIDSLKFNIIKNTFYKKQISNYLYYSVLKDIIQYKGMANIDPLLEIFNVECTNAKYKTKINKMANKWAALKPGELAPDFVAQDTTGADFSLSSFKGKFVYIDVWASWCAPCVAEIPHLSKLYKEYKSKNIEIISISIDKNKSSWMKMLKTKKTNWLQLHIDTKTGFAEKYMISSIPRFMLIDDEGKIIEVNSERPSGKIKEKLDSILK